MIGQVCFLLLLLIKANWVLAQCPIANSCTPGSAPSSSFPFGMGIYDVTIGSGATGISNPTTGGASAGYQDYSCTKQATVLEGVSTSITVTTNPNVNENVKVWVDLNNNGIFDNTAELIFSSVNAKVHTGSFTIPVSVSVVKNTVLRMRISADNFSSPIPTPCSTPQYSQVEDYGITVLPNTNKPTVDFSVNNPVTCSPTVQFQNQTQNGATSYFWNFGDGTTSTLASPSHTYAATGTYHVKLKACNANGCDSLTKPNYVTYHTNVPVAASCSPITTSFCCGYGITKVTFHTMVNTSQNGAAGYEDFTCTKSVTVEEGQTYPIALETNPGNNQDSWVYIDYNNDGAFSSNELVFSKLNAINPNGLITINWGTPHNIPLRMRVISDEIGTLQGPCTPRTTGQAEDYTIIITPNTRKPITAFTTNFTSTCDSVIQFTDTSLYQPTSFIWDFGDGSAIATTQNPVHKYNTSGTYTIKLKTCNNIGCDSIIKANTITITKNCKTYCSFNSGSGTVSITNVHINTINNTSGKEQTNYGNYTNLATNLIQGNSYTLEVTSICSGIYAYIDFNQDGDFFDYNESFVQKASTLNKFTLNIPIPHNAKTGITRLRIIAPETSANPLNACNPWPKNNYEVEEYSINIQPNSLSPITYFYTSKTNSCSLTAEFADTSANAPTSWQWNFGDPASGATNTSNLQNPVHTFSAPGNYTISLTTCKNGMCSSVVKNNYITISGNNGPRTITCIPKTFVKTPNIVTFTNISIANLTQNFVYPVDYTDYSCTHQINLVQGGFYPITSDIFVNNSGYFSNFRAWIDYNNDGKFNPISELIFSSNATNHHAGNFSVPNNAVINTPLRLRLITDFENLHPVPTPCGQPISGKAVDYSVIISSINNSTNKNIFSQQLKVYPNPGKGTFFIEMPTVFKGEFTLEVQNMIGQNVANLQLKPNENGSQVDLSHLPKGVYLFRISNAEVSAVKKIVIE